MEKSPRLTVDTPEDPHSLKRKIAHMRSEIRELGKLIACSQAETRIWMGQDLANQSTPEDPHSLKRKIAHMQGQIRDLGKWIASSQAEKRIWMGKGLTNQSTHNRLDKLDELIKRFADERIKLRVEIAMKSEWQRRVTDQREVKKTRRDPFPDS